MIGAQDLSLAITSTRTLTLALIFGRILNPATTCTQTIAPS